MKNAIAYMAGNGVAANILMLVMLIAGIFAARQLQQEVFPEIELDTIEIRVAYPGGSPQEIEDGIITRIEERLRAVDGIREITAVAAENVGVVRAELELGEDTSRRLDEIKAEVDRITSFPEDAETPEVVELTNRRRVMEIAVWGSTDVQTLKQLAYRIEDELSRLPEVSLVEVAGVPAYEISIEVPRETLRAYDLTLPDIADAVRRASLDLPAGEIETDDEEVRLRVRGQRYLGAEFEDIIIVTGPQGDRVRLRDIARVRDTLADEPIVTRFNDHPAVLVQVFRTGDERVLDIADAVDDYLATQLLPALPDGVSATVWQDEPSWLESRFALLLKNGAIGLLLVVVTLTLFLELRLALWVAAGILVSFVGTFAILAFVGASINMLTLFGFILAIGIVVDDAIVVGENAFAERARSHDGVAATTRGAQRVARPVVFAVSTTVIAFVPLLFVPGTTGKFLGAIPVVVISVLVLSLVESLFVLPHHLGALKEKPRGKIFAVFGRLQAAVDRGLQRFIDGPLHRALRGATRHPGTVLAGAFAVLLVTAGVVGGGLVDFVFFPKIESDTVKVDLRMPAGTPAEHTRRIAETIADRAREAGDELQAELSEDEPPLVRNVALSVGASLVQGGGAGGREIEVAQASRASVIVQLSSPEERELPATVFEDRWRQAVGEIAGVEDIAFASELVDFGAPVQVEISVADETRLDEAIARIEGELRRLDGVIDVRNDREHGQSELQIEIDARGRALGLTLDDLARQLRAAYYGVEAERMQRGPEEVRVYVRLPAAQRATLADLHEYRIRTPAGESLPLREIATVTRGRAPVSIRRRDARRIATISADVDPAVTTGGEINGVLMRDVLPAVEREIPGLVYDFGGQTRQQGETLAAMRNNFMLALLAIYAVLAISFRSWGQPLVVMAAIPFGIVGAIFGHLVLGLDVSMLSLFGIVGLAGVIVNDSLVMIDFLNERLARGDPQREAVIEAAKDRFRPILLTSLTTFLGVFPLVVEQSLQAQFLIPLAVSIGFGVLIGTVILMLVVSALAQLHTQWTGRIAGGRAAA